MIFISSKVRPDIYAWLGKPGMVHIRKNLFPNIFDNMMGIMGSGHFSAYFKYYDRRYINS